jgi:hypothetical protein
MMTYYFQPRTQPLHLLWIVPVCLIVIYVVRFVGWFSICGLSDCSADNLTLTTVSFVAFLAAAVTAVALLAFGLAPWMERTAIRWSLAITLAVMSGLVTTIWTILDVATDQQNSFF